MACSLCHTCRRLPHVSCNKSPKEAKPSRLLDLSDTDTEQDVASSFGAAVIELI